MDPKTMTERKKLIIGVFTNPDSPAGFSSAPNVLKEVKKKNKSINLEEVEQALETLPAYTRHKPRRIKFRRLKTIPRGFMTDVQVDLADFQKVAADNEDFKYMLVGVDVLSRRVFATPTKSKSSDHMIAAFKRLIHQMPTLPAVIFSDKGVEFEARPVKKFLNDQGIEKHVAQSPDVKAAVAERFIRTIKGRLYKYFSQEKTKKWLDVIPQIVKAINFSISRVTGKRPIDVDFHNAKEIWEKCYGKADRFEAKQNKRFKVGDHVRIAKEKGDFEKSYLPNFTSEIFVISKVRTGRPQTYELKDMKGEDITGIFYKEELSKAAPEKRYTIEKVLKTQKRNGKNEYLVKIKGQKEVVWLDSSEIL